MTEKMIRVYQTQLGGYCGPVVWKTAEDAIEELRGLLADMAAGDTFTVKVVEMTDTEFEQLPEFAGY